MSMASLEAIPQPSAAAPKVLSALGAIAVVVALWVASYWHSVSDIVGIWTRSETFAHGFVIAPISAYLIWIRRHQLAASAVRPAWSVLPLVCLGIAGWLLGRQVSVAAIEHLAVVAVLVFSIWCAIGHSAFRVIAFPIGFLMFMAPVGEFLLPVLMHYTAEFTVGALRLTGIPVYQESLFFVVPNGRWSVVEACSGIRYLIASLMVGMLYAYMNYRSARKRVVFTVVAIIVPVVANWLRAYMIVMIGYLSNNELATGVDHLIYGWVFFGVIIVLMFWIGSRWRDPEEALVAAAPSTAVQHGDGQRRALGVGAVAVCLFAGAWVDGQVAPVDRQPQVQLALPAGAAGWLRAGADGMAFRPGFSGFRADDVARYVSADGDVIVYAAVFVDQVKGHEMVNWDNRLVPPGSTWRVAAHADAHLPTGAAEYVRVTGPGEALNVWRWYQVGDTALTSEYKAKAVVSFNRLVHGQDASAHVVLIVPDEDRAKAGELVDAFLASNAQALTSALSSAMEPAR